MEIKIFSGSFLPARSLKNILIMVGRTIRLQMSHTAARQGKKISKKLMRVSWWIEEQIVAKSIINQALVKFVRGSP